MPKLNTLRLELTAGLAGASRQWMRLLDNALGDCGVPSACIAPLIYIARSGGGINQVTLAEQIGLMGPSLVRLLDNLAKLKLLRREQNPGDRRAKRLWLTAAGEALAEEFEARLIKLRNEVLRDVPTGEIEATVRVHQALARAADAVENPVKKYKTASR